MKIRTIALTRLLMLTLPMAFFVTGCNKDNDNPQKTTYTLSASATGAQEVPPNTTTGTGTLTGNYDANTNALTYTLSWTGLTGPATNMHFHGPALAGVSTTPSLAITGFTSAASGNFSGSATLTDAQEADLLAGKWYWNVHTAINNAGEIRGQVSAQ